MRSFMTGLGLEYALDKGVEPQLAAQLCIHAESGENYANQLHPDCKLTMRTAVMPSGPTLACSYWIC
jgi:hypothetical protein